METEWNPGILDCKVPKLILQPIVENCITHGFENLGEGLGKIMITGTIRDGNLVFEITDNGKGMDQDTIQQILSNPERSEPSEHPHRRTIGVSNTDRRLKLNFGPKYGVSIESKLGSYTKVTLTLPVIRNAVKGNTKKDESHVYSINR